MALGNAYIGYAITEVVMYRYFTKMYAAVFVQILNLNTNWKTGPRIDVMKYHSLYLFDPTIILFVTVLLCRPTQILAKYVVTLSQNYQTKTSFDQR